MKTTSTIMMSVVVAGALTACASTPDNRTGAGPRNHFLEARHISKPTPCRETGTATCLAKR